jgi:hypothetical protein
MTFDFKRTFFNLGTGIATSTLNVAHRLSVTPKVVITSWNGRTEAVDTTGAADHHHGMGLVDTDGGIAHWAVATMGQHNTATATRNCKAVARNDNVVVMLTTAGATDGLASITAVDGTNVTYTINDAFSVDLRCHQIAIGGTDVESVYVGSLAAPTGATGNVDYTDSGLNCSDGRAVVIFLGAKGPTVNTIKDDSDFNFGMAVSASQQRTNCSGANNNNATNTASVRYAFSGEACADLGAGVSTVQGRAEFVSWIAGGFRLNWTELAAAANLIGYIIIKGPRFAIVSASMTGTNTTQVPFSGAGFTPAGALTIGNNVASTQNTANSTDIGSVGAWDAVGSEGAQSWLDDTGVPTSNVVTRVEHDNSWCRSQTNGTANGANQLQSINNDGCVYVGTETGLGGTMATLFVAQAPQASQSWAQPFAHQLQAFPPRVRGDVWVEPGHTESDDPALDTRDRP